MANLDSAPALLNMNDFMSVMNDHAGLAKSCRFATVIRPRGKWIQPFFTFTRDLIYLTETSEMPGRGFMNIDVRYYGPNHKLPFQTSYEDINLTFLCRTESEERAFFDDWMTIINPINTFDFNYRDDYVADIDIYQFSEIGDENNMPEATYGITLVNAYPILVNPQPFVWSDDQFQRLVVSFTYTHWKRYGIDPEPRTSGPNGFSYSLVKGRTVDPRIP
jgi:hypothetical protein